jgi:hypothetical protein
MRACRRTAALFLPAWARKLGLHGLPVRPLREALRRGAVHGRASGRGRGAVHDRASGRHRGAGHDRVAGRGRASTPRRSLRSASPTERWCNAAAAGAAPDRLRVAGCLALPRGARPRSDGRLLASGGRSGSRTSDAREGGRDGGVRKGPRRTVRAHRLQAAHRLGAAWRRTQRGSLPARRVAPQARWRSRLSSSLCRSEPRWPPRPAYPPSAPHVERAAWVRLRRWRRRSRPVSLRWFGLSCSWSHQWEEGGKGAGAAAEPAGRDRGMRVKRGCPTKETEAAAHSNTIMDVVRAERRTHRWPPRRSRPRPHGAAPRPAPWPARAVLRPRPRHIRG